MSRERVMSGVSLTELNQSGVTIASRLGHDIKYNPVTTGRWPFKNTREGLSMPPTSDFQFDTIEELYKYQPENSDLLHHVLAVGSWEGTEFLIRDSHELLRAPQIKIVYHNEDFSRVLAVAGEEKKALHSITVVEGLGAYDVEGVRDNVLLEDKEVIGVNWIQSPVEGETMLWVKASGKEGGELYLLTYNQTGRHFTPIFDKAEYIVILNQDAGMAQRSVFAIYENRTVLGVVDLEKGQLVRDFIIPGKLDHARLENWEDPSYPLWFATDEKGASYSLFQGGVRLAEGLDSVFVKSQRSPDFSKVLVGADKKGRGSFISLNGEILFESDELEHADGYFQANEDITMAVTGFLKRTEGENESINLFYLVPGAHGLIPDKLEAVKNIVIFEDRIQVDVVKDGKNVRWIIRPTSTGSPEVKEEALVAV